LQLIERKALFLRSEKKKIKNPPLRMQKEIFYRKAESLATQGVIITKPLSKKEIAAQLNVSVFTLRNLLTPVLTHIEWRGATGRQYFAGWQLVIIYEFLEKHIIPKD
jgi:hypothetical protein